MTVICAAAIIFHLSNADLPPFVLPNQTKITIINIKTSARENGKFYGDMIEFVDFEYVANVTQVNVASLARLAFAPPRPKNVGMVTARLGNDTELKWDANADRIWQVMKLSGAIRMRRFGQIRWQSAMLLIL